MYGGPLSVVLIETMQLLQNDMFPPFCQAVYVLLTEATRTNLNLIVWLSSNV